MKESHAGCPWDLLAVGEVQLLALRWQGSRKEAAGKKKGKLRTRRMSIKKVRFRRETEQKDTWKNSTPRAVETKNITD